MLTQTQMSAVRRHMGVPALGVQNSRYAEGIYEYDPDRPFYAQLGLLDWRMQNLLANEEADLLGKASGTVALIGNPVYPGSLAVTATPSDTNIPVALALYNLTVEDAMSITALETIAADVVSQINANNTPYLASLGLQQVAVGEIPPQATFEISAVQPTPFTIELVPVNIGAYVTGQGTMTAISSTINSVVYYGILPICDILLSQIANASAYAAFQKASVVEFDVNEAAKRVALYNYWRGQLSDFFGIKLYPLGRMGRGKGSVV